MRAVIQKSGNANVEVKGKINGVIKGGYVILLGITHDDNEKDIDYLVEKICNIRLFEDGNLENHKYFEKSILETSKEVLVISQFTLYARTKNGRRPDFIDAAKGEIAEPLYKLFMKKLEDKGLKVEHGEFGAMMKVSLENIGPVTIILDSKTRQTRTK